MELATINQAFHELKNTANKEIIRILIFYKRGKIRNSPITIDLSQ